MTSFDSLKRLQANLDALRQQDRHFQLFGASQHHYQLNLPVTPQEVAAFEQKHGIVLPEDYRSFLLCLGNGGAGPDYGLFPPREYGRELEKLQEISLALPFLHQSSWQPDPQTLDAEALAEQHTYFGNYWVQGAMRMCHGGCGI